ncbi:TetR/AcrR family transcriptional regulator [Paenibacillus sp. EKM212P]|uniref:TetR/AcrR family transcriptional regulator n=1 Tax=Paenibacillus sp. EKM212P TaxID=1683680 RepID=UPI0013E9C59C|nr:helix-turn-helix domain-containing protein [Paenibacillus sp. EKM212P]KAF6573594.1 TetR/AcrR family transcriptional regulator [Paenibacillus sp. EKM212P]
MPSTGLRERKKNTRYKSIVHKAEKLFLDKGLDHVQMQDVADAEGIGIATLFRYFPKKDKLIVAVAVANLEKNIGAFRELAGSDHSAYERLENVLDYLTKDDHVQPNNGVKFREAFESYASFAKSPLQDIQDYIDTQKEISKIFMRIIDDGRVDGSIRTDIPVKETLITIINAYGTFGNNIALKSPISYLEDDVTPRKQQRILKEMLLSYIRS